MAPAGAAAERQRRSRLYDERSGRYCFSETCGRPRPHEWEGPASAALRGGSGKSCFSEAAFFRRSQENSFFRSREGTKKGPADFSVGPLKKKTAASYSPTWWGSTIGVGELNFSVRNG